jgi:hypothetical protein
VKALSGSACWASVAVAAKSTVSPTAQVKDDAGDTLVS